MYSLILLILLWTLHVCRSQNLTIKKENLSSTGREELHEKRTYSCANFLLIFCDKKIVLVHQSNLPLLAKMVYIHLQVCQKPWSWGSGPAIWHSSEYSSSCVFRVNSYTGAAVMFIAWVFWWWFSYFFALGFCPLEKKKRRPVCKPYFANSWIFLPLP